MVWLSKNNHTYAVARGADVVVVHLPTERNRELAELFGTRTGTDFDKFAHCEWRPGPAGTPILTDCPQWFAGRVLSRHDTGDHEGLLLEPTEVGEATELGQLTFQSVKHLRPGHEA